MPHACEVTCRDLFTCVSGSVALSLIINTGFARVMPTVEATTSRSSCNFYIVLSVTFEKV
jgi:hypothetical protein